MEVSMDYVLILKIALVGIMVSIINQMLKQSSKDELSLLTTLAGWILVLYWLLPHIVDLFTSIKQLFNLL